MLRTQAEPAAPARQVFLQPKVMTILATYKCTAACENCCFGSNPGLTERLTLEEIIAFIHEGLALPEMKLLVFSGGECFLLGRDLTEAIAYATKHGLVTRCVTNGYWAKSLASGRRRLRELRDAGLTELNVSTGDYHQEFVSEETVINAACLGVELGLRQTLIVIEMQKERRVTAEGLLRDPRIQAIAADREHNHFQLLETPWMPMEPGALIDQPGTTMLSRHNVHLKGGCDSIFDTVVVTPARKLGFCCGLTRERIPSLNAPWNGGGLDPLLAQAGSEFMKIWLRVDGPERILAWAAGKNPRIDWENRYAHHCHACLALFEDPLVRETILACYHERIDDVLMRYSMLLRSHERGAPATLQAASP